MICKNDVYDAYFIIYDGVAICSFADGISLPVQVLHLYTVVILLAYLD